MTKLSSGAQKGVKQAEQMLSDEVRTAVKQRMGVYPKPRSAILTALHLVQENLGWVPPKAQEELAEIFGMSPAEISSLVSFYYMFHRRPVGKYVLKVCRSISCRARGAEEIVHRLQSRLGIGVGETTKDGLFTLVESECLAGCTCAPVIQVNDQYFEEATPERLDALIDNLSQGIDHPTSELPWRRGNNFEAASPGVDVPLTSVWRRAEEVKSFKGYRKRGGYKVFEELVSRYSPEEVVDLVKQSGLRGRGGAGFPTGVKWSFVPRNSGKPKFLCVNADESEPGTCKDREIIEQVPHLLLEGILICCYAVGIERAFIYIRGEMMEGYRSLCSAVEEAEQAGLLGENVLGKGLGLQVVVHRGAGAYICGEESALLDSLEGKRGFPRLKPPFPAVEGLYGCPTVINNVETLSTLPVIFRMGVENYAALGTGKSKGTRMVSLSGHINRPGNYEVELGKVTFRDLIYSDRFGCGMRDGREPKVIIPGGASAPFLYPPEHLDVPLDFESIQAAGSMAGSGAVVVLDDRTCIVSAVLNLVEFFHEESCGKCSPCREGTGWLVKILNRIKSGGGRREDVDLLLDLCDNLAGKSFCPLGDSATSPVVSGIRYFKDEFLSFIKGEQND